MFFIIFPISVFCQDTLWFFDLKKDTNTDKFVEFKLEYLRFDNYIVPYLIETTLDSVDLSKKKSFTSEDIPRTSITIGNQNYKAIPKYLHVGCFEYMDSTKIENDKFKSRPVSIRCIPYFEFNCENDLIRGCLMELNVGTVYFYKDDNSSSIHFSLFKDYFCVELSKTKLY